MTTNIGILDDHRKSVSLILNTLLADEYVLYSKTKHFHWNVQGPDFHAMHLFFDSQAEEIEELVDSVAERVRALGHFSSGTLKEFLSLTHLLETGHESGNAKNMITALLNDHETIIREIRSQITPVAEQYKDAGTSDFLTSIMEKHETMAWMLRSHLA